MTEAEIIFETLSGEHGDIGLITLNRPKMLNALNQSMCIAMDAQLWQWQQDDQIKAVVIRGAGDRAFCAGGDIRSLYALKDEPIPEKPFFWYEYRLNHRIFHFPKPYIAFLDGLTMGGGVGLSVHGDFRIGTEKLQFAMPETGIGFFPDVGGSYFLPRCPGRIGWYLALSGQAVGLTDAKEAGVVTHQVMSAQLPELLAALVATPWADNLSLTAANTIAQFPSPAVAGDLAERRIQIDACFSQSSVIAIMEQLQQGDSWAKATAQLLSTRSPTSLQVTFAQLTRGAQLNFDDCMQMEYQMALQFLRTPDFYEGVRAAVVDKDRNPQWQPKTLAEIEESTIAEFFKPKKYVAALEFEAVG